MNLSNTPRNVVANYIGAAWNALMSFLFIPLYIKYLGVEAYGLIGLFASIQTILYLLDMGLSITYSREIARLSALPELECGIKTVTNTFATIYWGIAIVSGVMFCALAPFLSNFWLRTQIIDKTILNWATILMGLSLLARLPGSIYSGGLSGLQHQTDINIVNIISSTLRGIGVIGVLHFVSSSLLAFFAWQIIINLFNTLALRNRLLARTALLNGEKRFDFSLIKQRWKLTVGLAGINIAGVVLTQTDKIVLSKFVTLKDFGYYAIASSVAGLVFMAVSPIAGAFFPKYSSQISAGNIKQLSADFNTSTQLLAIILSPVIIAMICNSKEILTIWTRDPIISENTSLVLKLLLVANLFNAFVCLPYYLQIAKGVTRVTLFFNSLSLVFIIPAIWFLSTAYGIVGGAIAWLILNVGYILLWARIGIGIVLPKEVGKWYMYAVLIPLGVCVSINLGLVNLIRSTALNVVIVKISLGIFLSFVCLSLVLPSIRCRVRNCFATLN